MDFGGDAPPLAKLCVSASRLLADVAQAAGAHGAHERGLSARRRAHHDGVVLLEHRVQPEEGFGHRAAFPVLNLRKHGERVSVTGTLLKTLKRTKNTLTRKYIGTTKTGTAKILLKIVQMLYLRL